MSWIVTTTQQTAAGGEYTVLLDYEDNMLITMVDHTLGSRMIDVGQTTNTGDRVFEMIQRLLSIPHNMGQPLDMHAEMVEVCEIFQMISKSQTLVPIMMPVEILDRLIRHRRDTGEDARGQAREHMVMEMGWSDTRVPVILVEPVPARHEEVVTDPGGKDDDVDESCVEIHCNEGWIGKYEKMSEANEWSGDVSDKDISENK